MLNRRNEPFQYRLSIHRIYEDPPFLTLIIARGFVGEIEIVTPDVPIVTDYLNKHPEWLLDFQNRFRDGVFGFNEGLTVHETEEGRFCVDIPIPVVQSLGETCRSCKGTGEDEFIGGVCLSCGGSKRERLYEHREVFVQAASLSLLFLRLSYLFEIDYPGADAPPFQLLHVQTSRVDTGMHGASLGGCYSAPLVTWLSGFPEYTSLGMVDRAMERVWGYMHPLDDTMLAKHEIGTQIQRDGWLNISCPGDACGLHPSEHYWSRGNGYEFACHNTDIVAQQLTLLASLAALTTAAMQNGVGV